MKTAVCVAALMLLALPAQSAAQQMKLEIQNGRVTLEAQNVPVRQILSEWARVGGSTIVNGDKVVGAPLTLQIHDLPERQALDIILRGVSGYMLAERQAGSTGASTFDRILILPTSAAPRSNPAPAIAGFPGRSRPMPADVVEPVEVVETVPDLEDENDEPEPGAEGEEAPVAIGVNPRFQRRPNFQSPVGVQPQVQPFVPQPNMPGAPPVNVNVEPDQQPNEAQPPSAGNPFGVPAGASATPGVVTPVPQPPPGPTTYQTTYPQTQTTRPPR